MTSACLPPFLTSFLFRFTGLIVQISSNRANVTAFLLFLFVFLLVFLRITTPIASCFFTSFPYFFMYSSVLFNAFLQHLCRHLDAFFALLILNLSLYANYISSCVCWAFLVSIDILTHRYIICTWKFHVLQLKEGGPGVLALGSSVPLSVSSALLRCMNVISHLLKLHLLTTGDINTRRRKSGCLTELQLPSNG